MDSGGSLPRELTSRGRWRTESTACGDLRGSWLAALLHGDRVELRPAGGAEVGAPGQRVLAVVLVRPFVTALGAGARGGVSNDLLVVETLGSGRHRGLLGGWHHGETLPRARPRCQAHITGGYVAS